MAHTLNTNIEKNHANVITVKVRAHRETGTFRAYVRVNTQRFRTHDHATIESALNEANTIIRDNQ